MNRYFFTCFLLLVSLCVAASAAPAAPVDMPSGPVLSANDFAAKLDLSVLRKISLQHLQTVKTLDSFSREVLELITGRSSFDGKDPVYTVMDIAYHPEEYQSVNLIKIKNLPLRTEFRRLKSISEDERERIVKTGMVSLELLDAPDVRELLSSVQATDVRKAEAYQQVEQAQRLLMDLCFSIRGRSDIFLPAAVVPPAVGTGDSNWHRLMDVLASDSAWAAEFNSIGFKVPAAVPGYPAEKIRPAMAASVDLYDAWRRRDAVAANSAAAALADALANINPGVYPSALLRQVEVVYNRLAKMTLPGAAFYFFAFVCFLMSTRSGLSSLRLWGLRLLFLGFLIHTCGIGVRWWLVGSIPIKNEFESVMFSAWFGVLVGSLLELRFGRTFLGAAASFVGWISLIAIFTVPYVFHTSIGENIGQVNGVLMSYWLYIHVTMVTASYSMIGMSFLLSAWWLIKYYLDYGTLSRVSSRQLEGGGHGFEPVFPPASGTASLSIGATLARMVFFPVAMTETGKKSRAAEKPLTAASTNFLAVLDACNLVVLQLAFWTLGTGIVLGAVWADESWGRFWAWDPKETFALVTWIAYLIIVHVRVATEDKAWWTSALSIAGFFLMLFNWIGVNYFLPGLHSYAG